MLRVLIIDNEEKWRESLKDIFGILGCQFETFGSLNEFNLFQGNFNFDLAVIDIELEIGNSNFLDFQIICNILYRKNAKMTIVAITGAKIPGEFGFKIAKKNHIEHFLIKSDDDLFEKIKKIVYDVEKRRITIEQLVYKKEDQPWYRPEIPDDLIINVELKDSDHFDIELLILTATEEEIMAVINFLEPFPERNKILKGVVKGNTYFIGLFGLYKTILTKCCAGSGSDGGSTLTTLEGINYWKPNAVIMVGISFGKDANKQKIGDVLVASEIIRYEPQRVGPEKIYNGTPIPSDSTMRNRFENELNWKFIRPDGKRCKKFIGPVLSGEKLVDNYDFKNELFTAFPRAIGGEMEGAGLSVVCNRNKIPWILVKAISDWGIEKNDQHKELAAASAASLVYHVLSQTLIFDTCK